MRRAAGSLSMVLIGVRFCCSWLLAVFNLPARNILRNTKASLNKAAITPWMFFRKKTPLLSAIPALKLVGIKLVSSGGLPKRKRPTGTVKQRRGAVTGTQVKGVRNSDYVVQRVKGFNQKARTQWQKSCAAQGRQPQLQEHGPKWFAVGKGPRRQVRHTA